MKRLSIIAIALLTSLAVCAARIEDDTELRSVENASCEKEKTVLGVRIGINDARWISYDSDEPYSGAGIKFKVGFAAELPIAKHWWINTGLYYSVKGYREKDKSDGSVSTLNMGYLEVPVYFTWHYKFNPNLRLRLGVGPYVALAVNAKLKTKYNNVSQSYSGLDGYKLPDVGIGLTAGLQYKRFLVEIGNSLGFLKVSEYDIAFHNEVASLTVGYQF